MLETSLKIICILTEQNTKSNESLYVSDFENGEKFMSLQLFTN